MSEQAIDSDLLEARQCLVDGLECTRSMRGVTADAKLRLRALQVKTMAAVIHFDEAADDDERLAAIEAGTEAIMLIDAGLDLGKIEWVKPE